MKTTAHGWQAIDEQRPVLIRSEPGLAERLKAVIRERYS